MLLLQPQPRRHNTNQSQEKASIESYLKDGRSIRYGFRLRQLQKLRLLLVEQRVELLNALMVDLGDQLDKNAVEVVNILTVLKTIKTEYLRLNREYKKTVVPNHVDLSQWPTANLLILGNETEPLASLLVPLVYAIGAGAPAVLKLAKSGRLEAVLVEQIPKYLDSELYAYSRNSLESLTSAGFARVVAPGKSRGGSGSAVGANVVAIVDTDTSAGPAIAEVVRWKEVLLGKTSCAPDVVLVHQLHLQAMLDACKDRRFKVKVTDDVFGEFPAGTNPDVLVVAVASTETTILLLQTKPVYLFTYLGTAKFGHYVLKFATGVANAAVNRVSLTFYDHLSARTFQNTRHIVDSDRLASTLAVANAPCSYKGTQLPPLHIKYEHNMGFFEQGLMISLGVIGASTVSAVGYAAYRLIRK